MTEATTDVRIVPDFTGFTAALKRGVDDAVRQVQGSMRNAMSPSAAGAQGTGRAIGDAIASEVTAGARRAATGMTSTLGAGGRAAGRASGDAFGREFATQTRSAAARAAQALNATMATAALTGAGLLAKSLSLGFSRATLIQDAQSAMNIILGSRQQANWLIAQVKATVKGTPFNLDQFADAAKTLVAFNVEATKVPRILHAIGESASASGKGAEAVGSLVNTFGQMAATGRVSLEDVWSISASGVNALAILANGFGVTTDEMKKMISDGAVPSAKAIDMLTEGIVKGSDGAAGHVRGLGGSMEALRQTVSGAVGGFKAAMARAGENILGPVMERSPGVINLASQALDRLSEKVKAVIAAASHSPQFDAFVRGLTGLLSGLASKDSGTLDAILAKFRELGPLVAGLGTAMTTMGAKSIPFIGQFLPNINPVLAGITALVAATPEGREALASLVTEVGPLVAALAQELAPVVSDVARMLGTALTGGVGVATTALGAFLTAVTPVVSVLGQVTGFMADNQAIVMSLAAAYGVLKVQAALAAAAQLAAAGSQSAIGAAAVASGASGGITLLARLSSAATAAGTAIRGFATAVSIDVASLGLFKGLLASASSGLSTLGSAMMSTTGLAVGLAAAVGTLAVMYQRWGAEGRRLGNELSDSIIEHVGGRDGLNTYAKYQKAIKNLTEAEKGLAAERHKSGGLQNWDARKSLREGEKVQAAQRAQLQATVDAVREGARQAKVTTTEAFEILDKLNLDPATMDKNQVATTVAQEVERIGAAAEATGLSFQQAEGLGAEALDAWAKKAKAAQEATAGVLNQFGDILNVDLSPVSADTVASAQKDVADAQRALNELRAGGSSSLADASRRAREAADAEADAVDNLEHARHRLEVARTKDIGEVSWDELVNAEKAVKDGERELAQLRAKHAEERAAENQRAAQASADAADKEREAVNRLAEARKKLKQVEDEANKSPLTKIIDNYVESARKLDEFENLIRGAVERGFDPALIDRIIQAGPEKGIPILTAMVKEATDAQVKIINNYEKLMAESRARILRQQALTGFAVQQQTILDGKGGRQVAADLDIALRMDQVMQQGGYDAKSVKAMAKRLGISESDVIRVAKEYEQMVGGELLAADEDVRVRLEHQDRLLNLSYEPVVSIQAGNLEQAAADFVDRLAMTIAAIAAARQITATMSNLAQSIKNFLPDIASGFDAWSGGPGHAGGALVAQIGRNTRYRWAEPETGGEALIPRFTRNQARSESIAKTVAGWLGGEFITSKELSKTRFSFADGGIAAAQPGNVWGSLAGSTSAPASAASTASGMGDIRIEKLIVTGDRGPKGAIAVLREARKRRWLGASATMGGSTQW